MQRNRKEQRGTLESELVISFLLIYVGDGREGPSPWQIPSKAGVRPEAHLAYGSERQVWSKG